MNDRRIITADSGLSCCLTAIAISAKAHWKYPVSWLYTWRESLTITPAFIRAHPTFVCIHRNRVAGFYSVTIASTARMEHLWVLPTAMGVGIGRQLFFHAELYSIQRGCREMVIESDPHAEGFYRRMGAQVITHVDGSIDGVSRSLPLLKKVFPLFA